MYFRDLISKGGIGAYSADGIWDRRAVREHYTPIAKLPTTLEELFSVVEQTGEYPMWSAVEGRQITVFVYVDSQSRKWLLVLRYNHKGGTNPELKEIDSGSMPLPPSPTNLLIFADESKTRGWGHLSKKYLSQFAIKEVAFYGATSEHQRLINFTTSSEGAIDYVKGGSGNPFNFGRCFCTQPGMLFELPETAGLPRYAKAWSSNGSLTESPFSIPRLAYWSIRADGGRWEVDNALDPSVDMPPEEKPNTNEKSPEVRNGGKPLPRVPPPPPKPLAAAPKPPAPKPEFYKYHTLHMIFIR